jgi:tetratricopeptide (TPR) repeat protein
VEEDLHRARSRIVKGGILRRRLQFDQALQEFDQALHTRLQLLPPNHRDIGETYCMKGQLFEQQKLWDQAEHWFDLAKRSYSAPLSPLHRFGLARTHVFLAEVYKQTERIEEARKSAREALKLFCGSEELDPRQVKKAQEIAQDDVA